MGEKEYQEITAYGRMGNARKCDICTGCGRCDSLAPAPRVVSTMPLFDEHADLLRGHCGGLVTADIGTTTIAMLLHDEDGRIADSFLCVNPQVKYGADVLSRIRAAGESEEAAQDMRRAVLEILQQGIARFRGSRKELRMVIAGNTTMIYLLMGWHTEELGKAPFSVTHREAARLEVDGVEAFVLPPLSAFVGGDITAGIIACGMQEREQLTLLVDLGTNGEIVLGNRKRIKACATAAGPAFEGGANRGVWGADMVSLLATLLRNRTVDETGLLEDPFFEKGIRIGGVTVTQQGIRAVQLAKGAIMAGIRILCARYGCEPEQIDRVVLAGGFGYFLQPRDAAAIGLLPVSLAAKAAAGGNTALTGALCCGASLRDGRTYEDFRTRKGLEIESLNLAEAEEFESLYISSMNLCATDLFS